MTLILNSHYVWRMLQIEESLGASHSFQRFRSHLNQKESFETFLWQAVHSAFPKYSRSPLGELQLDADFAQGQKQQRRKSIKSKSYFNSEEGLEARSSGTHVPVKIKCRNARFCRFCSVTMNSKSVQGGRVTKRTGRRARTECSTCGVTLCTSIPPQSNDRRTCFEKWHKRRRL